jgi:hypothetical protein
MAGDGVGVSVPDVSQELRELAVGFRSGDDLVHPPNVVKLRTFVHARFSRAIRSKHFKLRLHQRQPGGANGLSHQLALRDRVGTITAVLQPVGISTWCAAFVRHRASSAIFLRN